MSPAVKVKEAHCRRLFQRLMVTEPFKSHIADAVEFGQDAPLLRAPATEGARWPDLELLDYVLYLTGQTEESENLGDHLVRLVTEILKAYPQVLGGQDRLPVVRSEKVEATP